jgi:hypothetical protein
VPGTSLARLTADLLLVTQASLHALARRASIVPHDLPESHLADPFKVRGPFSWRRSCSRLISVPAFDIYTRQSSAIQRKRLVAPQEKSDLVEPFKVRSPQAAA